MPALDDADDVFGATTSRFLSAGGGRAPKRSPSRQSLSITSRRSSASLRSSSLAQTLDDDAANGRQHSLAHELAAALMPEPSAGSKLLAEEFGIEYDEGAEGIDAHPAPDDEAAAESPAFHDQRDPQPLEVSDAPPAFADEAQPASRDSSAGSPVASPSRQKFPAQDPMVILAQDLEYTESFLAHLRRLDAEHASPAQPMLEQLASDMIRRINETTRDREEQVRELLECEREFRKLAGEVGGTDALGHVEELEVLIEKPLREEEQADARPLDAIQEEPSSSLNATAASDWEVDPDRHRLGEDDGEDEEPSYSSAPTKSDIPPPPPVRGPATPASTIHQLAHLRAFTASTASSLAAMSEHTQVNAAATTEAGRKIRALKNKIGGWRGEWDSAERSRIKIEKWEAGLDMDSTASPPASPRARRIDGRKVVQEHLAAFEKALAEANVKTQAIMTAVGA